MMWQMPDHRNTITLNEGSLVQSHQASVLQQNLTLASVGAQIQR
jgi:hypothetical protein